MLMLHLSAAREKGRLGVGKDCALGRVRALSRDAIDRSRGANNARPGGRPLGVGEALRDVGAQGAQDIEYWNLFTLMRSTATDG